MSNYREWLENAPMPSWMRGKWFSRWLYMNAVVADAIGEAAKQAVKARFITVCPDDAVPLIGEDRQIEMGIGESMASYRARVQGAWEAWSWAGTEKGLLDQLNAWLPGADWSLIANREWSVPPPGRPASPDYDPGHGKRGDSDYRPSRGLAPIAGNDWWSRMWVLLQGAHPWRLWHYGDGTRFGDDVTYGSTALPYHVETCKRIVRKWKAGHEHVPHIIVNLGTVIYGTGVPYGTFNYGGEAAYWPVTAQ